MKPDFKTNKIVPVVVLRELAQTLPVIDALRRGGITVAEITFRTPCAADAIRLASNTFGDVLVGAGTVINGDQCIAAVDAGAKFIVSPGFSEDVFAVCKERNVPYLPGAVTATEVMNLLAHGIDTIKFFPAEAAGGLPALKALAAPFPGVTFLPTGGIDTENMKAYLDAPFVCAVGGSWMLKGTPEQIEAMSRRGVEEANR